MKKRDDPGGRGHIKFDDDKVDTQGVADIRPGAPSNPETERLRNAVWKRIQDLPDGAQVQTFAGSAGSQPATGKRGKTVAKKDDKPKDDAKKDDAKKGGADKGGGKNGGAPAVDGLDAKDLAAQFGWNLAVLKSDPDLWRVFREAKDNSWSGDRFIAEVRSTGWFQTHSDATRGYIVLKESDPRTFEARLNQARSSVRDAAVTMGAQLSEKSVTKIADNFLRFGWNDSQLQDTLAGAVKSGSLGTYGGQAAGNVEHLRAVARANGVKLADSTVQQWAVRLAAGEKIEGFDSYVRNMATSAFPALADRIAAGENVADIAQPYIQQQAQTLELSPESIDLFDPTLRKALQAETPDGKVAAMPLWKFERQLRKDDRYDKTTTARHEATGFVNKLAQTFGRQ